MIRLDIKEYCQNCPYFEPTADTFNNYTEFSELTMVRCENATKCVLIASHIEAEMKKEKPDD